MKDDVKKINCSKEIKIHLPRIKQSERSELVKASQHLSVDSKARSSPKTYWSRVPFVSVDKISIDQPTDWNGISIDRFLSSYESISGGDTQLFTNDISVTNTSATGQSGDGPTDTDADWGLDSPVLINGKSPTISLGRLSLPTHRDYNSNFKGRKLTFDDQAFAKKKTLLESEPLLKQYSPTVSLKRLSLPDQLTGKERVKNEDSKTFKKVEEESIAMPSKHRRRRKRLQSKLTVKRSSRRGSPAVRKSWQEKERNRQTNRNIKPANTEPKFTGRPVSPVISDEDGVNRELRGHGHERQQTKRKSSTAQVEKRVEGYDKRKIDKLAKSASLKELVKRQKLKHADANENGDNEDRSLFSQEDGDTGSVIPENDEKERKNVPQSSEMSVGGEDKSLRENGKEHDKRRVEVSDRKTSDVLDKRGNLKELVKRQKLKVRDAKENKDNRHGSLFSLESGGSVIPENDQGKRENGQGTSGMSPRREKKLSPEHKNAGIFHELSGMKVVMRPLRKSLHRKILPAQIAGLFMQPHKPKKRGQKEHSETVNQDRIAERLSIKLGYDKNGVMEKSETGEENLEESSTVNTTEKIICRTEEKLTEKTCVNIMTEEWVGRISEGEKETMEGKSKEDVLRKKVEYIGPDDRVEELQPVRKKQRGSSCQGRNHTPEMYEKDEIDDANKALKRDDALKIEGSVQSVRKMKIGSTSHKRKCTPDTTGKDEIEGASKTLRRNDSEELDYLSSFCQLAEKFHKEKENDPGRIVGGGDSKLVPPAVKDGFKVSKVEIGNSVASISKESRDKKYTEKLKLKLNEMVERSKKGKELHAEEKRNCSVSQIIPGPDSSVGEKNVECNENVGDELQGNGEMKSKLKSALPAGKEKLKSCTSAELNIVQSYSQGEDLPDSGTIEKSQQLKDDPISPLNVPSTKEEDQTEGDDDVVLECIKSPKSVSDRQILIFMHGLFQTQDATKVPSPEETLEKLNKMFGQSMSRRESFVREHWDLMVARRVSTISSKTQDKPLATVGKYSLTVTDMASLENASWLNDNIINSYLHLLSKEAPLQNASFSSFFYQVYQKNGFEHVQRWHRKIDIFACHLILVPIHSRHHWCLVAVDNKEKTIIFFDSMRSGGMRYLMKIKAYMNEEAVARQKDPIEWVLQSKEGIPKQRNTSDCGVFVLQYAKRLCYGKQVTFSHSEATHFRQLIKHELVTKKLEPP